MQWITPAAGWRPVKKPKCAHFLLSLYTICADFQFSLMHLRVLCTESERITLCRLDLKSSKNFLGRSLRAQQPQPDGTAPRQDCAGHIASVFHAESDGWANCSGCKGAPAHLRVPLFAHTSPTRQRGGSTDLCGVSFVSKEYGPRLGVLVLRFWDLAPQGAET